MGEDYRLNKRLRNYSSRTELHRVFRISSLKKLRNWNWLFHSMIPIEGTSERYVDIITAKGKPHRNVINILFCQWIGLCKDSDERFLFPSFFLFSFFPIEEFDTF